MNRILQFAAITAVLSTSSQAVLISGVTATTSTSIAGTRSAAQAVDGSDLQFTGGSVNDPNNYTNKGEASYGVGEAWMSSNGSTPGNEWITFELGSTVNLSSMSIFNQGRHQTVASGSNPAVSNNGEDYRGRGIDAVDIYYRVGGGIGSNVQGGIGGAQTATPFNNSGWSLLGSFNLSQGPNNTSNSISPSPGVPTGPNQIDFGGIAASAVALDINSSHGNATIVGIGEAQFFAVPEPSTALLGLTGLGLLMRRRR